MTAAPTSYWMPTRPYSLVDAINRAAAATGSCRYAMAAGNADYNGHHVNVRWNSYKRGFQAYYTWAGLRWLAHSTTIERALAAALSEHARGALGSTVMVTFQDAPEEQQAIARAACEAAGLVPYSEEAQAAHDASWRTPLYAECFHAIRMEREDGIPATAFLLAAKDLADYERMVTEHWAERRRARGR
jgi:hypothetical protein